MTRFPARVDVHNVREYMFARYESKRLKCSQVRHLAGGSVVFPMYEAPVERDEHGRFRVWVDLVKPDHCNWTLTTVRFGLVDADGTLALETGFSASQVQQAPVTHHCIWKGDLHGKCREYRQNGNDGVDDTTISIRPALDAASNR